MNGARGHWAEYVELVDELSPMADLPASNALLVSDLGLDSLAIAELVAFLLPDMPDSRAEAMLATYRWDTATMADAYRDLLGPRSADQGA